MKPDVMCPLDETCPLDGKRCIGNQCDWRYKAGCIVLDVTHVTVTVGKVLNVGGDNEPETGRNVPAKQ